MLSSSPDPTVDLASAEGRFEQSLWGARLLLVVATAAIYANSLQGVFLFDDAMLWKQRDWLERPNPFTAYRPVTMLTFAANYAINGLRAPGYHIVNAAIHALAALALFACAWRTFRLPQMPERYARHAVLLATSIALLWAVHPLQTESVTFIIQRFESMMGLFYLLTLYGFVRMVDTPEHRRRWALCSIVCCALGSGCKQLLITAPAVVLWFDRAFVAASWRSLLRERRGYYLGLTAVAVLCAGAILNTVVVGLAGQLLPGVAEEPSSASSVVHVKGLTPWEYARSQPGVILHYLKLTFWPVNLCLDYQWPVAEERSEIFGPSLVLAGIGLVTLWCIFRRPRLSFLLGSFFLILAPTSSIVPIRDLAFEHRMYLPLASVVALVVVGVFEAALSIAKRTERPSFVTSIMVATLVGLAALPLMTLTVLRNRDYHNEVGMWQDVVDKRPNSRRGNYNLAESLVRIGRYQEAEAHYLRAIEIEPNYSTAHNNLGNVYRRLGKFDLAKKHFRHALRVNPQYEDAHQNLGATLAREGDLEGAIRHYRLALRYDPNHQGALSDLGNALIRQDKLDEAVDTFRELLVIAPKNANAHNGLATALLDQGKVDEAIHHYQRAIVLRPDHPKARQNLARAQEQKLRGTSAEQE